MLRKKMKLVRPITPGLRFRIPPDFSELTPIKKPEKSLLRPLRKSGGRNNTGKMTLLHIGQGHKKRVRIIEFNRQKYGVPARVKSIEYDPCRTAFIARLYYQDGSKSYIIAPRDLQVGSQVIAGENVAPEIGNAMPLKAMPLGTVVHAVELHPNGGAVLARSAGAYAKLVAKESKYVTLKLPSGEIRMVLGTCKATVGVVSNANHANVILGKAGRNRWKGRRPRVRGVAMNPVDHAMGGGEGKASGGLPRSKAGIYAKGQRTRIAKKYSARLIIKRRK